MKNFDDYVSDCVMNPDDPTDVADAVKYYCQLHRECGDDLPKPKQIVAKLMKYGLPEEEVEDAVIVEWFTRGGWECGY